MLLIHFSIVSEWRIKIVMEVEVFKQRQEKNSVYLYPSNEFRGDEVLIFYTNFGLSVSMATN